MQLRQLEYFVTTADLGSISAAAERLHVVQSGLSSALRILERELGTPVFERTPRGVRLTDAGAALLPLARRGLATVDEMVATVDEVRHGLRGTVSLGTIPALGHLDLPRAIARFRDSHPGVTVSMRVGGSSALAHALEKDELDFALVSPVGQVAHDVALRPIASSPYVAVVPPGHVLANLEEAGWEQLIEHPFVDSPQGFGNRDLLDAEVTRRGLHRDVVVESPDAWSVPRFVSLGTGIALVPRFVAARATVEVRVIPLDEDAALTWPLYLATSRDRSPSHAGTLLIAQLLAHVEPA